MVLTKRDKKIKDLLNDDFKDIKRHNNALYEKFQDDIKVLVEEIQTNTEKIDAVFGEMGKMKEDVEVVKQDISFIKQELRKKQMKKI